uniref:receptor protein serine/threonine kinase n=1 Tax=Junco hyemalis TaxID=40217 RepID=A0A8C5JPT5_JUNHY
GLGLEQRLRRRWGGAAAGRGGPARGSHLSPAPRVTVPLSPGCWGGRGDACPSATCAPSPAGHPGSSVLLCLCHGHLCNGNATGPAAATGGLGGPRQGPGTGLEGAGGHSGLGTHRGPQGGPRVGVPGCWGRPVPAASPVCVPAAGQVLQSGRFSAVWRGTLRQRPVAIKAFAAGARRRFAAERAVHSLPLMEHENVARLLHTRAAAPRARGGLLVLQLYPAGSLRHFLGQHVGTWAGSVRLALSLARGLAFLHQELWRDGLYKPSVVHRDLSSQNVLVREDGTCAIGDFGLQPRWPRAPRSGPGVAQAGTQRYLAPEILDESLDLRAWGRALRQADVYALGLLLWEILSRCQALSPGEPPPVPPFRLAYEAELGSSPSGAQLRRLAADERRRPLIPPAWHRTPQVRLPWGLLELLWGQECAAGAWAGPGVQPAKEIIIGVEQNVPMGVTVGTRSAQLG